MTQGARAVQTSILEKFEHADISVTIVWIRMLPNDTLEAASMAAGALTDSRVRHFFDPEKQAGQAIASSLRWESQTARDTYLFYAPGQQWEELPPPPVDYAHQLTNAWADRDRLKIAGDLVDYLNATTMNLFGIL